MPIRRELRKYYGPAWRAYRADLIRVRGNRCSKCGRTVTKYLNLCHTSHDPRTSSVALMCPGDHNRHDSGHRLAVGRRNRAKRYGQLWLWPEVENAPFAAWMLPKAARVLEKQEGLFG
jgi:hypothetical protein